MPQIKVYGLRTWTPVSWPIEPSPNGNRQRMVAVATTSVAKAVAAFNAAGLRTTVSEFRSYGYGDMGREGQEEIRAHPGVVYWEPWDRYTKNPMVPAPVKAQA